MDWLQFISSVIAAVAWPAALVALALLFKDQLKTLVSRLKEVSGPGGTGAKFIDELEKSRAVAEQLVFKWDLNQPTPKLPDEPLLRIAITNPGGSIALSYSQVEHVIKQHWMQLWEKGESKAQSIPEFLSEHSNRLGTKVLKLYDQLRETRNAAVHARPGTVTPAEAIEFMELSDRLVF